MQGLILASSSSRRHSLLIKLGLNYSIAKPSIDETPYLGEPPKAYVLRMAQSKARAVLTGEYSKSLVLAADTVISYSGNIIGKPENNADAKRILQMLAGHEHDVLTGLCCKTKKTELKTVIKSKVKFKLLTDEEINTYCETQEPYDKAGAYAIQGNAARFIEYVSGSYSNVVGLPLLEVAELLEQANLTFKAEL